MESGKCASGTFSFLLFCPFFPSTTETSRISMLFFPSHLNHILRESAICIRKHPSKYAMGCLFTTALASSASSLMDDGKSLHLTLREGERIYHGIFLASQKQYRVGKFHLHILVFVSPTGLFPSKPFEGSVCNPYFLIKTLLQLQPFH